MAAACVHSPEPKPAPYEPPQTFAFEGCRQIELEVVRLSDRTRALAVQDARARRAGVVRGLGLKSPWVMLLFVDDEDLRAELMALNEVYIALLEVAVFQQCDFARDMPVSFPIERPSSSP